MFSWVHENLLAESSGCLFELFCPQIFTLCNFQLHSFSVNRDFYIFCSADIEMWKMTSFCMQFHSFRINFKGLIEILCRVPLFPLTFFVLLAFWPLNLMVLLKFFFEFPLSLCFLSFGCNSYFDIFLRDEILFEQLVHFFIPIFCLASVQLSGASMSDWLLRKFEILSA